MVHGPQAQLPVIEQQLAWAELSVHTTRERTAETRWCRLETHVDNHQALGMDSLQSLCQLQTEAESARLGVCKVLGQS